MRKKILLSAFVFSSLVHAQQKPSDPKTEPTNEPSKIKVYTPNSSTTAKGAKKDNSYKWDVKTDIFGIISGEIPVIVEYRIAKKFSVEGSAGLTYAYLPNDFLTSNEGDSAFDGSSDTKAAMGTAFRGTIKYYPSSDYDAIEGWNFGIQLFTKTMNRQYAVDSSLDNAAMVNGKKDTKIKTGASLIIGKQIFQDSNITFESFIGIGFASVKRTYYDNVYNENTSVDDLVKLTTKDTKPNFQLGCRIGFGN